MEVKHTLEHQNRIGDVESPGLLRNVLTPNGKRWQLWDRGIRGAEADKVIEQMYGSERTEKEF